MWVRWLRHVWAIPQVAEAIGHASESLAEQVRLLIATEHPGERETRRTTLSIVRYVARMTGRPTPAGLFAAVAPATFGDRPRLRCGKEHRAVARADSAWLARAIEWLEQQPDVLNRLLVQVNSTATVCDDRLLVPYQPHVTDRGTGAAAVSLRYTPPVRMALGAARQPVRFEALAQAVQGHYPGTHPQKVTALLTELVARRALITGLHAPSTSVDALEHLLAALEVPNVPAWAGAESLSEIRALLVRHEGAVPDEARILRAQAAERMRALVPAGRHPVAVDVVADAEAVLPAAVAHEAERAARLLARLSLAPQGTAAMGEYHERFYRRYGPGSLVPLLEVVSGSGIGWPAGYPGAGDLPMQRGDAHRDGCLMALAQRAAVDGHREVRLDGALLEELEHRAVGGLRLPPHLELCVRLDATGAAELERGDFRLTVLSASRAVGVVTGRFLRLLPAEQRKAALENLACLPTADAGTLPAQLSFPPLDPASAHVTRTEQVLPTVISLGEHRLASAHVLTAEDLAVGCDGHRLYLAVPATRRRVEAWGLHALNLLKHTPPLARLITELSLAQCAQVTEFDWGVVGALPFLPRLRHGRVVLSPARWRLSTHELPKAKAAFEHWSTALTDWCHRWKAPARLQLTQGDWRLPLDLGSVAHRTLLREHMARHQHALLTEAPPERADGWCEGRAHELVIPLSSTNRTRWPDPPRPSPAMLVDHHRPQLPGTTGTLAATILADSDLHDHILARHLPQLLARLSDSAPPRWWFLRHQDEREPALRLFITTAHGQTYASATRQVGAWAHELRSRALLRSLTFTPAVPQTGRFGTGSALTAAEDVLAADTATVLAQLRRSVLPDRRAMTAAHFTAMACAFTGSPASGTRWLIDHAPAAAPPGVPRPVHAEALRLANPEDDFAALRRSPGGPANTQAWITRHSALAAYRSHFPGPETDGISPDAALDALLHSHFLRAYGIRPTDKAMCLHLARAAAMAWAARRGRVR